MTQILRAGRRAGAVAGITALVIAATAGGYAGTAGGTIKVCVHRRGGGLYQARHCRRQDRKLSWNARGERGPSGGPGPLGPAGPGGPVGSTGPAGPLLSTLPSGRTETGTYYASAYASSLPTLASTQISFPIPLASAPTANYLTRGSPPTAACPGSPAAPAAAPGNLCIYESSAGNNVSTLIFDTADNKPGASAYGVGLLFRDDTTAGGGVGAGGTWAVSAP